MAGIIKLSVDLYDNAVTEKKGDYTGRTRITGTLRNADIVRRIIEKRTEYRPETIENILKLADQEKVLAIAEGKSVVDGVGQYLVSVSGSFDGEKAPFDPKINSLGVSYTPGKLLRDTLKTVTVETHTATTGPVINEIIDSTTEKKNETLTSGSAAIINGINIKVLGEDSKNGIFFTKTGGTPQKVPLLIHNNPSQLTVMLPAMEDGEYTLSIVTQGSSNNKTTKEPRTYVFPVLLTVGEGSGGNERPDEV